MNPLQVLLTGLLLNCYVPKGNPRDRDMYVVSLVDFRSKSSEIEVKYFFNKESKPFRIPADNCKVIPQDLIGH